MALVISAYLCKFLISEGLGGLMCGRNFLHSQRVVASQKCMASEHYFLLVALVFFRMSSAGGSRAFPRVFAGVLIASDHCFLLVALVLCRMSLQVSDF